MNPDIAILSGSSGKLPNAAQTLVSTGTEDGDQPGAEAACGAHVENNSGVRRLVTENRVAQRWEQGFSAATGITL